MIKFAEDEGQQTVAMPRVTLERVTEVRESVTKLQQAETKTVTKKQGRPPKAANAMTAAQKQRAYRERAKAAKIVK